MPAKAWQRLPGPDPGPGLRCVRGGGFRGQFRPWPASARRAAHAAGLPDEAHAQAIGQKMVAAFDEPFVVEQQVCHVGLTAGYALAPLDGHSADELLKRADAAMYAGKQAGRRRVQRGGRSFAMA